jgi:hypothetical protein
MRYWTVALRRAIFKQKKGFATFCLGLSTNPWSYLNNHLVTLSLSVVKTACSFKYGSQNLNNKHYDNPY